MPSSDLLAAVQSGTPPALAGAAAAVLPTFLMLFSHRLVAHAFFTFFHGSHIANWQLQQHTGTAGRNSSLYKCHPVTPPQPHPAPQPPAQPSPALSCLERGWQAKKGETTVLRLGP
jgi:hypothetical protein